MTFWHKVNGVRYSSRSLAERLQVEAATLDGYQAIVQRAYGTLRGVTFGPEERGQAFSNQPPRPECRRCGTRLDGIYCKDETCPYSEHLQNETWTEE